MSATFRFNAILLVTLGAWVSTGAFAEDRIMFATGGVQIRNEAGELRAAIKGAEIRPGDTIVTSSGGYVQAKMQAGFMAVRPDSRVRLDAPLPSLNRAVTAANQITLQQGAVRMIAAKQEGLPKAGVLPTLPEIVIVTPNANISLSNSDGEAVITPPKVVGAMPTTISLVNKGAALVQGVTGAPAQVMANQGVTVAGKSVPTVVAIAALPALPPVIPKTLATLPTGSSISSASLITPAALPAVPPKIIAPSAVPVPTITAAPPVTALPTLATDTGKVAAVAPSPVVTSVAAPVLAITPPPAIVKPLVVAPVIAPVVTPTLVVAPPPVIVKPTVVAPIITPVVTPLPVIVKPPVIAPVITPIIVPTTVIKPTLTCTTVLINGIRQQVCK